jgi:RNase P/RNase MRP subunit POP5
VKQRYLALKIESVESFEEEDVKDAVWSAVTQLFGEYGASQVGLFLVQYDRQRKEAVLRCSHKALERVHASIASVTKIGDKPVAMHVLRISGTLRALKKKLDDDSLV